MAEIIQTVPCALSPRDKRDQARRVGEDLVRHYGKRKFYTVEQVRASNRRRGIGLDVACWSHALFNTHEDFDRLHQAGGEACDYNAMKKEMLESVSGDESSGWLDFDFDLSWLEFPDIDWSIFDFFDA
ncbi:MAG TPA: DUF6559 family protein [Xanthomonadaceae bacterium]|nr:DUF6559 family protein [Xanthomonadaceae bacterium]